MFTLRASGVRAVNDKIRWTSHSGFVNVASVAFVYESRYAQRFNPFNIRDV